MPTVMTTRLVMLSVCREGYPRGTPTFPAKADGQIKGVLADVFDDIGAFSFHTRNIPRWSWEGKEFQ